MSDDYVELVNTLIKSDEEYHKKMREAKELEDPPTWTMAGDWIETMLRDKEWCEQHETIKQRQYYRPLNNDKIIEYTPLDAFLFNYSANASLSKLDIIDEEKYDRNENTHSIFFSLRNNHGEFYFFVELYDTSAYENTHIDIIDHEYSNGERHLTIRSTVKYEDEEDYLDRSPSETSVLVLTHIIIQRCKSCFKYQGNIKMCKGCWDNLRIRVPYCSKTCQTKDFNQGRHKEVCGCRNHRVVDRRLGQITALGLNPESAFRS